MAPETIIAKSPFRDETVNMRVPFEVSTERVKDANKPRSKVFSFIKFRKHTKDDISDGMKKTIQKRMILKKEDAKFLWNRKHTVSVDTLNEFNGHGSCAMDGIKSAA